MVVTSGTYNTIDNRMIPWYNIVTMEGETPRKQGKSIKLKAKTIERLEKIKHQGQSYDGIVAELLDFYDTDKGTDSSGKQAQGRK